MRVTGEEQDRDRFLYITAWRADPNFSLLRKVHHFTTPFSFSHLHTFSHQLFLALSSSMSSLTQPQPHEPGLSHFLFYIDLSHCVGVFWFFVSRGFFSLSSLLFSSPTSPFLLSLVVVPWFCSQLRSMILQVTGTRQQHLQNHLQPRKAASGHQPGDSCWGQHCHLLVATCVTDRGGDPKPGFRFLWVSGSLDEAVPPRGAGVPMGPSPHPWLPQELIAGGAPLYPCNSYCHQQMAKYYHTFITFTSKRPHNWVENAFPCQKHLFITWHMYT